MLNQLTRFSNNGTVHQFLSSRIAYAYEASDLRRKARNTDVSQVTVGVLLRKTAGIQSNAWMVQDQLVLTLVRRTFWSGAMRRMSKVQLRLKNPRGSSKKLVGYLLDTGNVWHLTTEFEAHLLYIKPAEITLMEQEMAQSNSSQQYLGVYIRYFEDVYAFYPKSFHRSWRFRRLCKIKSSVWQCHFHDMWHPITSCTHCQNLFYLLEAIQTIDNKLDYAQSLRFCLHLFYLQWPAKTTCLNYM
ncbi:hypothetical protein MIR68_012357 [Amoeboaphelidium protococcarum]|nr:hypothetical protein MIR68_012357 [Amoeboaphelidium protococcarum]